MRAGLVSIVLTTGLFTGVGYLLWLDEQSRSLPQTAMGAAPQGAPSNSPGANVPSAPRGSSRGVAIEPAPYGGLYKCTSEGRVSYQDSPCSSGQSREIERGTLTVVSPPPVSPRPANPTSRGPGIAMVEREAPPIEDPYPCPSLRARIRRIDAQARIRSTEYLTEERRQAKRRMYELRCPEIEPQPR